MKNYENDDLRKEVKAKKCENDNLHARRGELMGQVNEKIMRVIIYARKSMRKIERLQG